MAIAFTQSQLGAVNAFRRFLAGPEQVLMLKGAAGTGKTTLVAEFLRILDEQKREAHLMAPTGRAAYIIGSKTGHEASTIHRGIYSLARLKSNGQGKDDDNDSSLNLHYALRANKDSQNDVYIIDEASMVSDRFSENEAFSFGSGCLLTDLFDYIQGRKIVFVGDYAQLPPVGMNSSPALDACYIDGKFGGGVTEVLLREVVRQAEGSAMLGNASKIRDSIERKSFVEFRLDDGEDSVAEEIDLLRPYFDLYRDKPGTKAAVITYSNKQALEYNLAIRRHYYGAAAPRLKAGDLLIICRNNYAHEYELFNGNIVQVAACDPDSDLIRRQVRVKMGKNRIETVELNFRKATIRFAVGSEAAELNVMLLDNFLDDPSSSVGGLLAPALIVDFNNRLPAQIKGRLNEIRRLMRSKDKLTVEQQELRDAYIKLLNKDPYYNAVICKYGYAMTCHKAQGGEWDHVFADMCRFGGTSNENYFRWAYTALTRASKKLWHYHAPDFNYISGLVVEGIKRGENIKVSSYSGGKNFLDARFRRIKELAQKEGLTVSEDRSKQYQHLVTFTDSNRDSATFQLWYNKKGYSQRDSLVTSSSDELTSLCSQILEESYAPDFVPYSSPDRPFAEKLVKFLRSQLQELDIKLLDITRNQYQDIFHLRTDGLAQVGFYYTDNGNYTHMTLVSSLGADDKRLKALRERFI